MVTVQGGKLNLLSAWVVFDIGLVSCDSGQALISQLLVLHILVGYY